MDHTMSEPAPTRPQAGLPQGSDPALNGHRPDEYVPPWLEDIPKEYHPEAVLTDTANAWRFAQACAGRVRYVEQWGRWLVWAGRRWAEDHEGRVLHYAREAAASIYGEAQEQAASGNKGYAGRLADWAKSSQSDHALAAMLRQGQSWPSIAATPDQFDAHAWLLNVRNGIVDLRTGKLGPHDPTLLITRLVDITFDPDARCPRWLRFLLEITGRNKAMVRFLQRAIGYSLTADVSEEAVFILHGTGANGKSTKIQILRDLAGDYGENVQPETLASVRYQSGSAPTPDIARLRSARCVTTVETAEGFHLNEPLIKQLTSREPLTARFLHRDPFEFSPTFKIWLATNHRPAVRGTDWGIWRRLRLIPFTATIPSDRRDPHLIDKLRAELSGILAWVVRARVAKRA